MIVFCCWCCLCSSPRTPQRFSTSISATTVSVMRQGPFWGLPSQTTPASRSWICPGTVYAGKGPLPSHRGSRWLAYIDCDLLTLTVRTHALFLWMIKLCHMNSFSALTTVDVILYSNWWGVPVVVYIIEHAMNIVSEQCVHEAREPVVERVWPGGGRWAAGRPQG